MHLLCFWICGSVDFFFFLQISTEFRGALGFLGYTAIISDCNLGFVCVSDCLGRRFGPKFLSGVDDSTVNTSFSHNRNFVTACF